MTQYWTLVSSAATVSVPFPESPTLMLKFIAKLPLTLVTLGHGPKLIEKQTFSPWGANEASCLAADNRQERCLCFPQ